MKLLNPKRNITKSGIVLGVALVVTSAGCQTTNPYTGQPGVSKTTIGAGIGAVSGAIAGALISGKRKNVLIGAGIGALTGGLVGNYMDRQEAALRAQLQGTGVSVTRNGDQITLNMPGNVTFATDSSDISANFYPVLDSVALIVNEYKQTYVDVLGHTDSTGSAAYNQALSERRAASVARYLQSHQVLNERIITRGLGENAPIADNNTMDGRALNRRVEIILTPLT